MHVVIRSTKDRYATNAVKGSSGKGFPGHLIKRTRAMRAALNATVVVEDLRLPPGNHLEEPKGDRAGRHSVRIIDQWCVCVVWMPNGTTGVDVVDCH
ncbi:MAG: type II toxin-antitoxin system RelE/ParE family toxin [bacterium]|nr:type II toxin-antitoxin system RelE/ParE family toxin [bacterium]